MPRPPSAQAAASKEAPAHASLSSAERGRASGSYERSKRMSRHLVHPPQPRANVNLNPLNVSSVCLDAQRQPACMHPIGPSIPNLCMIQYTRQTSAPIMSFRAISFELVLMMRFLTAAFVFQRHHASLPFFWERDNSTSDAEQSSYVDSVCLRHKFPPPPLPSPRKALFLHQVL